MSYETAPATEMVATCCACCAKPLVDAISVETGVGPECRRKHSFAEMQGPADWARVALVLAAASEDVRALAGTEGDAQAAANALVHRIALDQVGAHVAAMIAAVDALGFATLAARIAKRVGTVEVTEADGQLTVKAPFSEAFNVAIRSVPGARWIKEEKTRRVPVGSRVALWKALRASFPRGMVVRGPRGLAAL